MGYYRYDQICEELVNLHHHLESVDGSRSLGFVTPEMNKEADEIRAKMNALEGELEGIDRNELPNPRL